MHLLTRSSTDKSSTTFVGPSVKQGDKVVMSDFVSGRLRLMFPAAVGAGDCEVLLLSGAHMVEDTSRMQYLVCTDLNGTRPKHLPS